MRINAMLGEDEESCVKVLVRRRCEELCWLVKSRQMVVFAISFSTLYRCR